MKPVKFEELKKLMEGLLLKCKVDKKALISLKTTAVKAQEFELASGLRDIENELFPITEEQHKAKKEAEMLQMAFKMVELNVSEDTCWLINETVKRHQKLKGKFSLRDAAELITKKKELFDIE